MNIIKSAENSSGGSMYFNMLSDGYVRARQNNGKDPESKVRFVTGGDSATISRMKVSLTTVRIFNPRSGANVSTSPSGGYINQNFNGGMYSLPVYITCYRQSQREIRVVISASFYLDGVYLGSSTFTFGYH
jgi:hypothetical protein